MVSSEEKEKVEKKLGQDAGSAEDEDTSVVRLLKLRKRGTKKERKDKNTLTLMQR